MFHLTPLILNISTVRLIHPPFSNNYIVIQCYYFCLDLIFHFEFRLLIKFYFNISHLGFEIAYHLCIFIYFSFTVLTDFIDHRFTVSLFVFKQNGLVAPSPSSIVIFRLFYSFPHCP